MIFWEVIKMPKHDEKKATISIGVTLGNDDASETKGKMVEEEEFKKKFDEIQDNKENSKPISLEEIFKRRR